MPGGADVRLHATTGEAVGKASGQCIGRLGPYALIYVDPNGVWSIRI